MRFLPVYRRVRFVIALLGLAWLSCPQAQAEEAQWIWSPAYEKEMAPPGDCYFRKTFTLGTPEAGEIQIGCDDHYELYVNGQHVGSGSQWKVLDVYDVTAQLVEGKNTIAVKSANRDQGSAGLVARVLVKQQGGTQVAYSTDATWKTALKEFVGWQKQRFNDSQWLAARSFGKMGATLPWGNEVTVAGTQGRFKVQPDFNVEWVVDPRDTGSLIAMTFDEFGQVIGARENGPLILIRDSDHDGLLDTVAPYCEELKNCQGLLTVSGRVFAVGQGPDGTALYRLTDHDHDGQADQIEPLVKFTGEMGEHGPHGLTLGPDGLIYMIVGNFSRPEREYETSSPYHHYYEGDLLQPRYEDASGHAVGIKAPGGSILRTDTSGTAVEIVAGGLQNPYDLTFTADGELFTADSDMEWDLGMPWFRPTRVVHAVPGAEFGWRSGWAKWPSYYFDSLTPAVEMGRGSPTGIETYNHHMFPRRYHNSLFVCDWSRGRIMCVKLKPHGASYKATTEVFLEGQPLNVTDVAVGPDGWLYFCTGGRDTEGGIFRVTWQGDVPEDMKHDYKGIAAAIHQPQLASAWARQQVAIVKKQLGAQWEQELNALLDNSQAPPADRVRALELLQLFGPHPSKSLLIKMSRDKQASLRAKAAYLMGPQSSEKTTERLGEMLADSDLLVQRMACESLARSGQDGPVEKLVPLLGSRDRNVAWAARRALERVDRQQWDEAVIQAAQPRVFLNGCVSLMAMYPDNQTVTAVLNRSGEMMNGYLSDEDFRDLLRVIELALMAGQVPGHSVPDLRRQLADEYPSQEFRMNRELVRLLAYLQEPTAAERVVSQLESDQPPLERVHAALCARYLTVGWNTPRKLAMLKFFEEARSMPGGHSYVGYIENVSRDFFAGLTEEQRQAVLVDGAKWPTSALSVLARLPERPSKRTLYDIRALDRQVKRLDTDAARKLRIGIAAVLGQSRDPDSMEYLRDLYENEPDRRVILAMALSQQPEGDNWPILVRSLSIVEGSAAQEILAKLSQVDRAPQDPEVFRQTIIRGLMLRENGSQKAIDLLEKWTDRRLTQSGDRWQDAIGAWQNWFAETYPESLPAELPQEQTQSHWTYQELLSYVTSSDRTASNPKQGAAIFEKAGCVKCHRFDDKGDTVGPDLTTVAKRFQRKEILESILYPSQVISDQYGTQTVVMSDGRTISGMVSPVGDGSLIVLQSNGEKLKLKQVEIESVTRSKVSSMPEGLLNKLTLEEVGDLFAYLTRAASPEVARKPPAAKR